MSIEIRGGFVVSFDGTEHQLISDGGMTFSQAIMAGTLNSAKAFSADSQLGSIEQGKHADLLVLEGSFERYFVRPDMPREGYARR
jgi:imidazolonepropionase-like amidohydrolase